MHNSKLDNHEKVWETSSYNPSRFFDSLIGQDETIINDTTTQHNSSKTEETHVEDQKIPSEITLSQNETEVQSHVIQVPFLQQ